LDGVEEVFEVDWDGVREFFGMIGVEVVESVLRNTTETYLYSSLLDLEDNRIYEINIDDWVLLCVVTINLCLKLLLRV
jgi:hypothetical protein